jgi:hypothetical protein
MELCAVTYPLRSYFPRNQRAPAWVSPLVGVMGAAESEISTPAGRGLDGNAVLLAMADGLAELGFQVEKSKIATDKIARPVLFGDQGLTAVTMEIDRFTTDTASRLRSKLAAHGMGTPSIGI